MENLYVHDAHIVRAKSPLFLRLSDPGRVKPGDPKPGPGRLRRIAFEKITGAEIGSRGSMILGHPERKIEDVVLSDVSFSGLGRLGAACQRDYAGERPHHVPGSGLRGALAGR